MSDALDIYDSHRAEQLQNGPFSETFTFGSSSFKGIFDNASEQIDEDSGGVSQKVRRPRILCDVEPDGVAKGTVLTRTRTSTTYTVFLINPDDQGVVSIWLR